MVQLPAAQGEWMKVGRDLNDLWNFSHCLGAMDGKHTVIQAPSDTESDYFNYKSQLSIALFVLVNANYTRVVPKVMSNFFFACELGTADEGECGGRWNQLLCYS